MFSLVTSRVSFCCYAERRTTGIMMMMMSIDKDRRKERERANSFHEKRDETF